MGTAERIAAWIESHGIAAQAVDGGIVAEDVYCVHGIAHVDTVHLPASWGVVNEWLGY